MRLKKTLWYVGAIIFILLFGYLTPAFIVYDWNWMSKATQDQRAGASFLLFVFAVAVIGGLNIEKPWEDE